MSKIDDLHDHPKQLKNDLVTLIHEFFSTCKTYDLAMEFLKTHKLCKFFEYTQVSSRKILLSLVIYQFGKEIDYPENLQAKARQMILFLLRNKQNKETESSDGTVRERKKIVKEFLEEFDQYKKEDLKKYMYELGVEYAQLQDIKDRLGQSDNKEQMEDSEIWMEQIDHFQKKILEYVHFSNGYDDFQKCLASLLSIKQQVIEDLMEKAYWDMFLEDLQNKNYKLLLSNFQEIKSILLEMHEDEDTKEIMDENYLKQLIEKELFDEKAMIGQIEFIYGKMKKYGIPVYDQLLEKNKKSLIEDIKQNGLGPEIIVKTFQKIIPLIKLYIDIIQIYRKKINEIKTNKNV